MKKKAIVVTGGLGFIGRNLITYLDKKIKNYIIIAFDKSKKHVRKLSTKSNNNQIIIVLSNTINIEKKLSKYDIDTLFHLGEFSRIVPSFKHIKECFLSNQFGTFNVLKFCANRKIKVIYSASSSKFGNNGNDEHLSPYSWSKSKNIELIKNFHSWYGLNYEIVYFYNVYGKGHLISGRLAAVIGIFEGQYIQNRPLTVVGDGTQSRDFTHVDDIVRGTYLAWKKNLNKEYMLGTGNIHSLNYIANLFNHKIKYISSRSGERLSSIKINHDAYKYLKYRPKIKIENYIKNFIRENGK
jgi:UDP-glucose 4-epimerase